MVETAETKGGGVSVDVAAIITEDPLMWPSTRQLNSASEATLASPEWRATEKRLVRKLDMTLLPMVFLLYTFNYLDRNNIAYAGMQAFYVTSMGFNGFFPTIVQGLHFGSQTTTLLLTAPPYLFAAAVSLVVCTSSDKRADRGLHIMGPLGVSIVGFVITAATTNHPVRYFASYLYVPGAMSSMALIFSWSSTAMSETTEKRAAGMAIVCLICQLGGVWSPYFFRPEDSPRYLLAFILMIASSSLCIATVLSMRRILGKANKRLVAEAEGTGKSPRLYIM
ncbi:hypothetical protein LX32DRAFT_684757 [Colletotrichum zoysiae]|uniref:Major facilitator superfamily transporter n=1 Tax=Colletotrichum zoysiae TaxID=1216348 RepID=A0AAD9LXP2_9PEZI|nr:hypothetical protein LX32DRAFT_684757 [Colletotrichum zoysiae]